MKKKNYEEPEMLIIKFVRQNVIVTSDPIPSGGGYDGEQDPQDP